jgi:hypothetical protein
VKDARVRLVIAAATLLSSGCARYPDPSAPPPQRAPVEAVSLPAPPTIVEMGGPGAERAIVKDITGGQTNSSWRWTGQAPAVRVALKTTAALKFHAEFAIPEVTFRETGPVTIRWMVNGRVLDTVRYARPGSEQFEKPVPPDWLKPNSENVAGAELDKIYVAKGDGAKLGVILSRIGFVE